MSEEESGEKSHEPSQRKLDEARKKGEIPRAPDLLTAMAYLGLLVICLTYGAEVLSAFSMPLVSFLDQPVQHTTLFFSEGSRAPAGTLISGVLTPALPILLFPGVAVLATLLATRSLLFSPEKLKPKLSRISLIENAKNKYGRRGLFEFAKSFVKLVTYSVCLALFLRGQIEVIVGTVQATPGEVVVTMMQMMLRFLAIVVGIALIIGGIDFWWQRLEHLRRNRMSMKDLRDEQKDAEGDPHMKGERKARGQQIALNQMMADVPSADVIIVNPTHFAVALKWERQSGTAPVCVAKGQDNVAFRIRELGLENGIPIHSDPPTARALFATTQIGEEIEIEHYKPVAAAIRFADEMRRKAKVRL